MKIIFYDFADGIGQRAMTRTWL